MMVDPEWRRKGIAMSLLKAIEEDIRRENKVKLIKLEASNRRKEGPSLYTKFGFELCEPYSLFTQWEYGQAMQKRLD